MLDITTVIGWDFPIHLGVEKHNQEMQVDLKNKENPYETLQKQ